MKNITTTRKALDWTVATEPIQTVSGVVIPGRVAIVKEDGTPLGVAGGKYGIVQNSAVLDGIENAMPGGTVERWGTTSRGLSYVEVTGDMQEVDGFKFAPSLTTSWAHDGSSAVMARTSVFGYVCSNGLVMSTKSTVAVNIRHTASAAERVDITFNDELMAGSGNQYAEQIKAMTRAKVSREVEETVLRQMFPDTKTATGENLRHMVESGNELGTWQGWDDARVAPWRGTVLGLVQIVNTFDTWHSRVRGSNGQDARAVESDRRTAILAKRETRDLRVTEAAARADAKIEKALKAALPLSHV